VRPMKGLTSEITRAFPPGSELPSAPALFYLSTGDVLPGSLLALDRSSVEFGSSVIENTRFPANMIEAIQFGAVPQTNLKGFTDSGWHILKGDETTIRKTDGGVAMEPGTAIAHPAAMQCSEIRFLFISTNFCAVRLRLFCDGTDGAQAPKLMLMRIGDRLESGMEGADGQFDNQTQTSIPVSQPAAIRLAINDKQVDLYLNDILVQKFPIASAKRPGAGLVIEPASMWGNSVNPIELSGFSATSVPGRTWLPDVSPETRSQTLMVPRFRKDDPPHHALLAANGDVLRGEIEAATASHFGFRSGLEMLRVPRDRVKAAIWLKKPAEDSAPAAEKSPVPKSFDRKIVEQISFVGAALSTFIEVLKREAPDLKFKLPEKKDNRKFPMQFGGQTIEEALDQICTVFGLHYRLDSDGTIILEAVPNPAKDLVQKVYWLKPDAFPNAALAQEVLAGKGVPFPIGATASWQPNARQLSMTNIPANQRKLAEVLEADFGGLAGEPTHWLLLTNGGQLGLTVDQFGQDAIIGHHPIYGSCKVPMAQVYIIRTSLPPPTVAMKSLADWRLVYAPEPVLPETGGESSPSLGKTAQTFKLPLLGGGEFDLEKEKGKVIVLDFWATWCGPCVKALPELIQAMSTFPTDRVKLIGVNQSEPAPSVKSFLEARNWPLTVALDAGQIVARQYGVDGIPHTVIVGPDGKVAWVKTGYSPDGGVEAANAVKQLLAPPPSAASP
jgi:thiol-disulfide isomerase/thioredoxin